MSALSALQLTRLFLRRSYPFTIALGAALALIVFKGRSITENVVYLFVLLPFIAALTKDDLRRLVRNPVLVALAGYLLMLAVSLIGNGTATPSELLRYLQRIAVELAFAGFVAWHIGRARPNAEIGLGVALALVVALDVVLTMWMSRDGLRSGGAFILAPWPNQNTGAAVSAAAVLLLANAFVQAEMRAARIGIAVVMIAPFAAVLLSRSRTALVALVIAVLATAVLQRRWRWLFLIAVAVAGAMALASVAGIVDVGALWARGDASRVFLWKAFGEVAQAHIWRGIGINREFSIVIPVPPDERIDNPHNMFVLSVLYAGVGAMLAYMALLGTCLAAGFFAALHRHRVLAQSMSIFLLLYGVFESALMTSRPDWLWLVFLIPIGCIAGVWFHATPPRHLSDKAARAI